VVKEPDAHPQLSAGEAHRARSVFAGCKRFDEGCRPAAACLREGDDRERGIGDGDPFAAERGTQAVCAAERVTDERREAAGSERRKKGDEREGDRPS
jgi:hypothetical protein